MTNHDFTSSIQASTLTSFDFPVRAGVAIDFVSEPQNVLAMHIGNGTVILQWDAPDFGVAEKYVLYVSNGGSFQKWNLFTFNSNYGTAYSLPVGSDLQMQLGCVSPAGYTSNFATVQQGKPPSNTITIRVRGMRGSVIPASAIFTAASGSADGLLTAIQFPVEINL